MLPAESLPESYGVTTLIVQARDPEWLHAYWEVPAADRPLTLRVYELTAPTFAEQVIRRWWDVALTPEARDWFVEVGRPAAWWCLELGTIGSDGRFTMIVRSNLVETPAAAPSDEVDEAWGLLGEAFAIHYGAWTPGTSPGSPRWRPGAAPTTH